eukprot:6193959-Pleurochrysis_carterae.AAC.1
MRPIRDAKTVILFRAVSRFGTECVRPVDLRSAESTRPTRNTAFPKSEGSTEACPGMSALGSTRSNKFRAPVLPRAETSTFPNRVGGRFVKTQSFKAGSAIRADLAASDKG